MGESFFLNCRSSRKRSPLAEDMSLQNTSPPSEEGMSPKAYHRCVHLLFPIVPASWPLLVLLNSFCKLVDIFAFPLYDKKKMLLGNTKKNKPLFWKNLDFNWEKVLPNTANSVSNLMLSNMNQAVSAQENERTVGSEWDGMVRRASWRRWVWDRTCGKECGGGAQ